MDNTDELIKKLAIQVKQKLNNVLDTEISIYVHSKFDICFSKELKFAYDNFINEIKYLEQNNLIKDKSNKKALGRLGAACSACIKRHKRDLIKDFIMAIFSKENMELSGRTADLFYVYFLKRSIGTEYLYENFAKKGRTYKDEKILTHEYKKIIHELIIKYENKINEALLILNNLYLSKKKEFKLSLKDKFK